MKKLTIKRVLSLMAVLLLAVFMVACGSDKDTGGKTENVNKDKGSGDSDEPVTLKIFTDAKGSENPTRKQLFADFTEKTGIQVEDNVIPGEGVDIYQKIDISLSSGDKTDLIYMSNALLTDKYASGKWLLPLNDLIAEDNYDAEGIFGDYLTRYDDELYSLPSSAGKWAVYYNKQVFDDAGVDYPKGNWTWEEYIETAKKLNNPDEGVYGSYMLDYDAYLYFLTRQYDIPGYNDEGLSNYDDPAFAESLQFFSDLGSEHKIQPNWLEQKTKKLSWDGFMSGSYGMHLIGTWYTDQFTDKDAYPRDWEFGITQIPVPADGKGSNNLVSPASIGINKNSEHADAAYEFVKFYAENHYKYIGTLPAQEDLNDEQIEELFGGIEERLDGEVTVAEFKDAIYDSSIGIADEKIVGKAANEYANIILQEGELFLIGEKSLEDTIASIKSRADDAIENADE